MVPGVKSMEPFLFIYWYITIDLYKIREITFKNHRNQSGYKEMLKVVSKHLKSLVIHPFCL